MKAATYYECYLLEYFLDNGEEWMIGDFLDTYENMNNHIDFLYCNKLDPEYTEECEVALDEIKMCRKHLDGYYLECIRFKYTLLSLENFNLASDIDILKSWRTTMQKICGIVEAVPEEQIRKILHDRLSGAG